MSGSVGGAPPASVSVKLDGIAYLDDDRVIAGEVGLTAAEQPLTMSVSEIRDALAS